MAAILSRPQYVKGDPESKQSYDYTSTSELTLNYE